MKLNIIILIFSIFFIEANAAESIRIEGVDYDVIVSSLSDQQRAVRIDLKAGHGPGVWLTLSHSDGTQAGWQHIRPGGNYIWPAPSGSKYHQVIAPPAANAALYPSTVGWLEDSSITTNVSLSYNINPILSAYPGYPNQSPALPAGSTYVQLQNNPNNPNPMPHIDGKWIDRGTGNNGTVEIYHWAWKYYTPGSPPTPNQIKGQLTIGHAL